MTQEQYRESFVKLKALYPLGKEITIRYMGSGDSFEEFSDVEMDGKQEEEWTLNEHKYTTTRNFTFDITEYEDLLFAALDCSDADFNNEGADGTITINLENESISVDNYYYHTESEASGEITLDVTSIVNDRWHPVNIGDDDNLIK